LLAFIVFSHFCHYADAAFRQGHARYSPLAQISRRCRLFSFHAFRRRHDY
jgi:hypothetical protein